VIPWFYQATSSTLKVEAESIPESPENLQNLTGLCARDFIEFCRRESVKPYETILAVDKT
jgi:hypothetical protein